MPTTPLAWIAQILNIVAMLLSVASMQCRRLKLFYTLQFISCLLCSASFLLKGDMAIAGALFNAFGLLRSGVLLGGDKLHKTPVLAGLLGVLCGCSVISYIFEGPRALLPFLARTTGTIGMWTRHNGKIRILQFCIVSPLWLTYDVMTGMLGSILGEIFNMISIIVFVCRFGFKELLRPQPKTN